MECVPLTISHHLYFLRISKVSSMLLHGSVGRVHSKEYHFIFKYTFFTFFFVFHQKKLCFYRFHFFFWWNTKFLQQNINQPETGIGDKKLPAELYVCLKFKCVNHSGDLSKKRKIYCFDIDKPFMLYMLSTISLIFSVLAIQIQFIALWLAYQVISVMI